MRVKENDIKYLKDAKELLINIDMVNGFVKEGVLAAPSIMRIVPRQIELLEEGLKREDTGIIFIRDSHSVDAEEFNTYPVHCVKGTYESELIDELKKFEPYALEYLKNSTNLVFVPKLQKDLLNLEKLEKIRLMGCLSEVCVLNGAIGLRNFFDEYNRHVEVMVHPDAIDTFDSLDHPADLVTENALKQMQSNGIKVLSKKR